MLSVADPNNSTYPLDSADHIADILNESNMSTEETDLDDIKMTEARSEETAPTTSGSSNKKSVHVKVRRFKQRLIFNDYIRRKVHNSKRRNHAVAKMFFCRIQKTSFSIGNEEQRRHFCQHGQPHDKYCMQILNIFHFLAFHFKCEIEPI